LFKSLISYIFAQDAIPCDQPPTLEVESLSLEDSQPSQLARELQLLQQELQEERKARKQSEQEKEQLQEERKARKQAVEALEQEKKTNQGYRELLERDQSFRENSTMTYTSLGQRWATETPVALDRAWDQETEFAEIPQCELESLWASFTPEPLAPNAKEAPCQQRLAELITHLLPSSQRLVLWEKRYIPCLRSGSLAPDFSITERTQTALRWSATICTGEVKPNLESKLHPGVGQAITYIVNSIESQPTRRMMYAFLSDSRRIVFFRVSGYPKIGPAASLRTDIMELLPSEKKDRSPPTPGFKRLAQLLRAPLHALGYIPPTRPTECTVGGHRFVFDAFLGSGAKGQVFVATNTLSTFSYPPLFMIS
jgi:hypothetical protein